MILGKFVESFTKKFRAAIDDRMTAGLKDFAVNRFKQTFRTGLGIDPDDAAGNHMGSVANQNIGPAIEVNGMKHEKRGMWGEVAEGGLFDWFSRCNPTCCEDIQTEESGGVN